MSALIDGRYKLAGRVNWRLFDLVSDPKEIRPLQAECPDLVRMMRGKFRVLSRELRNTRDLLGLHEGDTVTLDQDTREKLQGLGYSQ